MATGTIQKLMPTDNGVVRPNLLYNWYFVGGGSQQGEGYFPINSKGQTSYSGTGVTIDGWQNESLSSVQVQANGVAFNGSGGISNAFQALTNKAIYGKTVTVSALEANGTLSVGTATVPTKPASGWVYQSFVSVSTYNLILGVSADGTIKFFIQLLNSASIVLAAIKLELGDSQTLAHQVNGAWVLNEVPNYYPPSVIRSNIGIEFGNITSRVMFVSNGGDNGAEFRIYGSDNTVYALDIFVNAIALNVSYDGGQTWQNKWTK